MSYGGVKTPSVRKALRRASFLRNHNRTSIVGQICSSDRLARFCAFAGCSLILSFFAITPAFADEPNDRKINTLFFWTLVQLNVQVIVCSDYLHADAAPVRQKLKQYWHDKDGISMPDSIFEKTVKEMQASIEKLTTAERQQGCKEALRETIWDYSVMRKHFLMRKLDKGIHPPLIELDSLGLQ